MLALDFSRLLAGVEGYGWTFLRITGFMLLAPLFGSNVVPRRVKLTMSIVLTLMLAPIVPAQPTIELFSAVALLTALQQLLIGLAIGFVTQIVFDSLILSGQIVSNTMGLGFATMVDPSRGASTAVVGQFFLILGILLMLAMDGHIVLLGVLADSFRSLPPGPDGIGLNGVGAVLAFGGKIFEAGTLIALPAVVGLVLVNLALGIVSRAAPQLNLFAVGFPMTMLLGFIMLMLCLPALPGNFERFFGDALTVATRLSNGR